MILESDYGDINFRGTTYNLKTTNHTHQSRGSSTIPRDSLTKTKYESLISSADLQSHLISDKKIGIIWKHTNGKYKGILIVINNNLKSISVITTYLFNSDKPDKIFPTADQRIILQ